MKELKSSVVTSFVLAAGMAFAPLLAAPALGGAPPAQARTAGSTQTSAMEASSTVIVATTPTPTDCGKYHSAVTDLAAALTAAKRGKVLICPGAYIMNDAPVITSAANLTIGQAVKGMSPTILVTASEVGLEVNDSSNVIIDGLIFDATRNPFQDLIIMAFGGSSGKVRHTALIGSETTATGIVASNIGGLRTLSLTVEDSQFRGFQAFGVTVSGPMKLKVKSSHFDSTDGGRFNTGPAVAVEFDGNTDDPVTPTGEVTRSTFRSTEIGVKIVDGRGVTVRKSEFTGGNAVWVDGGVNHALSKDNRIIRNTMTDCFVCVLVEDEADDPAKFQLLDTLVAHNTIRLTTPLMEQIGVDFLPFAPALSSVTGTVMGNTFIGFNAGHAIFNNHDWAGITVRDNTIHP